MYLCIGYSEDRLKGAYAVKKTTLIDLKSYGDKG